MSDFLKKRFPVTSFLMFSPTLMFFQNEDETSGTFVLLICLVVLVVYVAALWKVFAKAGQPGWAAIVPIYNIVVLLKIAGRPIWWIILLLIPLVNLVIDIIVSIDVAKKFGKGAGFGVGLALLGLIFYPILGFGSAEYIKT